MWWWLACSSPPAPEPVARGPRSVRARVSAEAVVLEADAVRLTGPGPEVRLVGMVHVGDPAFYDAVGTFLAPCTTVLYEGLAVDPDAPPPDDGDVAVSLAAVGLTFQRDALAKDDRWVRADSGVVEVRAALAAAGSDQADAWLVDRDREALRGVLKVAEDDRMRAVVRLSFVRGLAGEPLSDAAYWDVVIGGRDAGVVDAVVARAAEPGPIGVVYGADHLPDLAARLTRRGYTRADTTALPVVTVPLGPLGLGPVQARQFLTAR